MDLNLPTLNGFEATRRLRSAGFNKPIFALSASTSTNHQQQAIEAGCDQYVIKPFDTPHLLTLIQQVIDQSRSLGMSKQRREELDKRFKASLSEKVKLLDHAWITARSEQWSQEGISKLRHFIHNLAGSAGLYGYDKLSDTAKQIDNLLYDTLYSDTPANSGYIEVLSQKIRDLRDILSAAAAVINQQ